MRFLVNTSLLAILGLTAGAAVAGPPRSLSKTVAGMTYKLTLPHPLPMGAQKLQLKIMQGAQTLQNVKLTATVRMADGMKSPVKVLVKPSGELELQTRFTMEGDWQLQLQQTAPTRAQLAFALTVQGGGNRS